MSRFQPSRLLAPALLGIVLTSFATLSQGMTVADARELSFYHTHTGKRLNVVYKRDGEFLGSALDEINEIGRAHV